ncbi:MAG: hypothetical protein Q9170_003609 [Blastenia crenularia]
MVLVNMLLFCAAFISTVVAFPEISHWKKSDTLLQRRAICYGDDTLQSFREWIVDSEPYCSSLLGIVDVISTLPPATSRTGFDPQTEYAETINGGTSTLTVTQTALPQPNNPYYNASLPVTNSSAISGSPSASIQLVTTVSMTSTRINTIYSTGTGLPYPINTTSVLPPYPTPNITVGTSPTSAPTLNTSSISSTSTTSSLLPIGTSIAPGGCSGSNGQPSINNTIYTLPSGEQYQLQCYRAYGGPISIGLDQTYFRDCINECSVVNQGFSAVRCYGVTWMKYAQGVHCNLKSQTGLGNYTTEYESVSAVLLTGVPEPIVGEFVNREGKTGGVSEPLDDDPNTWKVVRGG